MTRPTVGDTVFYWPKPAERSFFHQQPFAAVVAHVWGENCVNVAVLSDMGRQFTRESVRIFDNPEDGECGYSATRNRPKPIIPKDGYE